MFHKCLPVGPIAANCYIIGCDQTKEAAVIDPGEDAKVILSQLNKEGLKLKYIINTHGHIDHIGANDEVKDTTGAQIIIHELDAEMLTNPRKNLSNFVGALNSFKAADKTVKDGDVIQVGNLELEVIHTPGHTIGGICLRHGNLVWTGDTLFQGSIGRSDFPGGNHDTLINSIKKKLTVLPDDTQVFPGHGPSSNIGEEKRSNPFL
ncbi:MAG: MBL fold metallo-hydrolase [Clostridia bacterium]|nr:MBL fold metallo-hydrolase [Clostridia bacterium]